MYIVGKGKGKKALLTWRHPPAGPHHHLLLAEDLVPGREVRGGEQHAAHARHPRHGEGEAAAGVRVEVVLGVVAAVHRAALAAPQRRGLGADEALLPLHPPALCVWLRCWQCCVNPILLQLFLSVFISCSCVS